MGRVRNAELSRYLYFGALVILFFLCVCVVASSFALEFGGLEPPHAVHCKDFCGVWDPFEIGVCLSIDIAICFFSPCFLWCTFTHVLSSLFHLSSRMDSDSEKDGPESEEDMQDLYPLEGKYKDEADKRESVVPALILKGPLPQLTCEQFFCCNTLIFICTIHAT